MPTTERWARRLGLVGGHVRAAGAAGSPWDAQAGGDVPMEAVAQAGARAPFGEVPRKRQDLPRLAPQRANPSPVVMLSDYRAL